MHRTLPDYDLDIHAGRALATLKTPADPVPVDLTSSVQKALEAIFAARQLRTHLAYTLEEMRICQHRSDGSTSIAITSSETIRVTAHEDLAVTDASGRVLHDSKAERISEENRYIDVLLQAAQKHPLVLVLWKSYRAAVDDPGNELIHLYEIFEALSKHFGAQEKARHCLHFTKAEWQCLKRLGQLANDEPLEQGRHRGRHPMLRPASPQELAEARTIAKKLVEAFMSTL